MLIALDSQSSTNKLQKYDEAFGNFRNIFNKPDLEITEFINSVEQTKIFKCVNPLEYFSDVGNGMNVASQKLEIEKIIPSVIEGPKLRAKAAIEFIKDGNHIGVSQTQYERDLAKGKDHDATMLYLLNKIISNDKIEPAIVVVTEDAKKIFGINVTKVILDGTHRAVICAITQVPLDVIEFSMQS